jgi:hypothetical protein
MISCNTNMFIYTTVAENEAEIDLIRSIAYYSDDGGCLITVK